MHPRNCKQLSTLNVTYIISRKLLYSRGQSHRQEEFRQLGLQGRLEFYWSHEVTWFCGRHIEACCGYAETRVTGAVAVGYVYTTD